MGQIKAFLHCGLMKQSQLILLIKGNKFAVSRAEFELLCDYKDGLGYNGITLIPSSITTQAFVYYLLNVACFYPISPCIAVTDYNAFFYFIL